MRIKLVNGGVFVLSHMVIGGFKGLSYLPWWCLYQISNVAYFVLFHLLGYRKKIIYTNLRNSFPEKSEKEIHQIAKKFYQNLCDILCEVIKTNRLSEDEMLKRFEISHLVETCNREYAKGNSIVAFSSHMGNWEWFGILAARLQHPVYYVYRQLHNPYFDKYMMQHRSRFGAKPLLMENTHRTLLELHNDGKLTSSWYGSDQTPPPNTKFWTMFLNQETPFFQGAERIAQKTNYPVYYTKVLKVKRGYYKVEMVLLAENPKDLPAGQVLLNYAKALEETIHLQPESWLWSHKRWKHKRSEDFPLTPAV